jgi:hypothetical protein
MNEGMSPEAPATTSKRKPRLWPKLILAGFSALLTLLCLEVFFRAIHYDFEATTSPISFATGNISMPSPKPGSGRRWCRACRRR